MNKNPDLEKRAISETRWNRIPYQQALQEIRRFYRFPDVEIVSLMQDAIRGRENSSEIRTPWAFYRIAQ